jgi:protein-tyrosine phosphatase
MISANEIYNFHFHTPEAATGGQINRISQLEFLKSQGITAVISLVPVPKEVITGLRDMGIEWLYCDVDDDSGTLFEMSAFDPEKLASIEAFFDRQLAHRGRVFIHCSAGASRSVMIARYLLSRKKR